MVNFKLSCETNVTFCIYFATFCDAITGFRVKWRRSQKQVQKIHTDDVSVPRSCSASDHWLYHKRNLLQPVRSTTQIWVVTCHQYGTFALLSQTSFLVETSGGVMKCCLFYQAKYMLVYKHNARESSELVHMHSLAFKFAFWIVVVPAFNHELQANQSAVFLEQKLQPSERQDDLRSIHSTWWNDLGILLVSIAQLARKFKALKCLLGVFFSNVPSLLEYPQTFFFFFDNLIACGCEQARSLLHT